MSDDEQGNERGRDRGMTSLGVVFIAVGVVFLAAGQVPGVGIAFMVLGVVFLANGMRKTIARRKG